MKRVFKALINLILSLITLGVVGIVVGLGLFWYFGQDLPDYSQLEKYNPPVVTRIHAGDGTLFAEYAHEKRIFIPINAIPKKVIKTFLAVEDKNFFDHPGLDWTGIIRASVANGINFFRNRGRTMGGSTITQQVAKNFLLTSERTLTRKIKEAILSLRIERTFSKEKILELYLNEIYLGSGTYGVGSAALHYFHKSLNELTAAECAYIAGLPKAPSKYHPDKNYQAALKRRDWVIHRMFEEKIIAQAEALEAINTPLKLNPRKTSVIETNYFAEHVRQDVIQRYGENTFYQGGLSVRTTLNSRLQKLADSILRKGLIRYDRRFGWRGPIKNISLEAWEDTLKNMPPPAGLSPWKLAVVLEVQPHEVHIGLKDGTRGSIPLSHMTWAKHHFIGETTGYPQTGDDIKSAEEVLNVGDVVAVSPAQGNTFSLEQIPEVNGALIALDPHTGRILAMNGGYRFKHSQFNRAIQARRQLGSAFKPIVYAAALEKGYTPRRTVLDAPIVIDISEGNTWKPQNITKKTYGVVTVREALEKSYNLALIRIAQDIGMGSVEEMSKRLGLCDGLSHDLANVLGAGETTLIRSVGAYASFVNGGKKVTPIFIDRIQDRHGKNIYHNATKFCDACKKAPWQNQLAPTLEDTRKRVLDPIHAYQITSMLEGCVKRGTSKRAAVPGYNVGGKTGTSSNYNDTWFVGFSPDLVVGVIVGFDSPKSLGRFQTGATVAAPIFADFMKEALKDNPAVPFHIPPGIKFRRVNKKTGKISQKNDGSTLLEAFPEKSSAKQSGDNALFSELILDETSGIY